MSIIDDNNEMIVVDEKYNSDEGGDGDDDTDAEIYSNIMTTVAARMIGRHFVNKNMNGRILIPKTILRSELENKIILNSM